MFKKQEVLEETPGPGAYKGAEKGKDATMMRTLDPPAIRPAKSFA